MLFAPQADDPVHIVQASFGADNVLLDARLENKSHNKIQVYRLGWVAVKKDDIRIGRGELVTVPEKVDTTAEFDITGKRHSFQRRFVQTSGRRCCLYGGAAISGWHQMASRC